MAEAFGIATAAVGLLPLCRDGFQLVREVVGASDSFKEVSLRVQSQINVFEEWRRSWKLEKDEWGKFKEYSKENQCGARAIGHELALLSFSLCNASKLLNTYGLKLKASHRHERPTEIQYPDTEKLLSSEASFNEWVKGCKMNLPFIKKCRFVLTSDKSNAEDLVDHLRERNEALYRLSPSATQVIQIQNIYYIIGKTSSDEQVEALRKEEERAKKSGQQSLPYEEFGHIAAFSNAVKEVREKKRIRDPQRFELSRFHTSPDYEVSASQAAEMGLLKGFPNGNEMRVVYIEWMSGGGEVEREVKAKAKARMLSITMSEQMLLPNCYGLLEDGAGCTKRFGLVLAPPYHIRRNAMNMMPGSISRRRKPKSLRTILLEAGDTKEDLGIRFNLAKKLVNAVHKMHCADWVHKNIRPGSILFFPTSSEVLSSKISSTPQLDYSKPFLVGFGQARVDDMEVWNEYSQRTRAPGEITLDEYQHPKKIEDPSMKYSRFFDVYSVGCVLLEIGMWLPLAELVDIQRHGEPVEAKRTRNDIQAKAKALTGITGSVYAGVVKKCLDADPQNHLSEEENKDACAALLSELIGELNKCSA